MRKLLPIMLLGTVIEVAWLLGGLEMLRGKAGPGVVGQIGQEVAQVKPLLEKAREAMEVRAATPPSAGDPSRNPFALPPGIQLLGQVADGQPGASGASPEKGVGPAPPPARELAGILVGPRERLAIIDGTIVRAGDRLDDERVVDIRHDRVVLARAGEQRTLHLPPPFPTTP